LFPPPSPTFPPSRNKRMIDTTEEKNRSTIPLSKSYPYRFPYPNHHGIEASTCLITRFRNQYRLIRITLPFKNNNYPSPCNTWTYSLLAFVLFFLFFRVWSWLVLEIISV
jgi:hypothetical protein